jgi:MFS family permease
MIKKGLDGFDKDAYGLIGGALASVPIVLFSFFTGFVVDNSNRVKLLAFMTIVMGSCSFLSGLAGHVWVLYVTTFVGTSAFAFEAVTLYSIAKDMFPARLNVRAFFILGIVNGLSAS